MVKNLLGKLNLGWMIITHIKNWKHVFFNYFGISHNEYINFKFRDGKSVKIRNVKEKEDTSGLATICEIFLMNNYCPKEMKIKQKDIIIDIGANIGVFSIYASFKAPKGRVYSYEPFQIHYNRLLDNLRLNNLKNIFPSNLAVCKNKGKRNLFVNKECSGMHSIIFKNNSREKMVVNCTTLEDIFKENKVKQCDFLKIDCEGAEYEIIYSSKKEI